MGVHLSAADADAQAAVTNQPALLVRIPGYGYGNFCRLLIAVKAPPPKGVRRLKGVPSPRSMQIAATSAKYPGIVLPLSSFSWPGHSSLIIIALSYTRHYTVRNLESSQLSSP